MLNLHEFWEALRARANTADMQTVLGGPQRVYMPSDGLDAIPEAEGRPDAPWGRILTLPRETLWPQRDVPGEWKNVAFILSVQFNDFRAPGYDVGIPVARAHELLYDQLNDWVPDPQPVHVLIAVPVWREGQPPVSPIFDQSRNLWLSNAQYRCQAVSR